jgi:site-specific recombinase XerD
LGPIADGFDNWLAASGYTRSARRNLIFLLPRVDADLRRRGLKQVADLSRQALHNCWKTLRRTYPVSAATARTLERYLVANSMIANDQPATATSSSSILIIEYANYLHEVRGFAASTISNQRNTVQCFLRLLSQEGIALKHIQAAQLESYITQASQHLSRRSLQNDLSALRGFLRFLALDTRVPTGIASQIDTPRLYRFEQLPRALPWETVRTLLRSIDRTSAQGLRDYAMFLLIATYGLRASEVVAITLEDLCWRQGRLQIYQRKTSSPLQLPLTNEVSSALVKHLKRTPPPPPYRRIFLRMRAPLGVLKPTAVTTVFESWVGKSGLPIPFHGPHCLRHSLAVHLLKGGTPLKTIGDILGHRSAESTSTYLRLATGDLREVPLPVPGRAYPVKEGRQ